MTTLADEIQAIAAAGEPFDRDRARAAFASLRAALSAGDVRAAEPDGSLLANRPADREDQLLDAVDREGDDVAFA